MRKGKVPTVTLEEIYETIRNKPGIDRTELSKRTGAPRGSLEGRLASLEHQQFKIFEDEYGRLFVDEHQKVTA